MPLKLTTNVKVIPDTIPFANKPSHLPTSVTLVCSAPSKSVAPNVVKEVKSLFVKKQGIAASDLTTHVHGQRCYFNWVPTSDSQNEAKFLAKLLAKHKCNTFAYQLESGSKITLPPAAAD
jgi:hypothetical protein